MKSLSYFQSRTLWGLWCRYGSFIRIIETNSFYMDNDSLPHTQNAACVQCNHSCTNQNTRAVGEKNFLQRVSLGISSADQLLYAKANSRPILVYVHHAFNSLVNQVAPSFDLADDVHQDISHSFFHFTFAHVSTQRRSKGLDAHRRFQVAPFVQRIGK